MRYRARSPRSSLLLAGCLLLVLLVPLTGVRAATVNVTTNMDTDNACATTGTGACSLRDAVKFGNANAGTEIILPAGRYMLRPRNVMGGDPNSGDLDILASMTIRGAGADTTTIDGGGTDRVIEIYVGPVVRISGVTISNGKQTYDDGGGIRNKGDLTLVNSSIVRNRAEREMTGNEKRGGGISNGGTLLVENTTIVENEAGAGGGIANDDGKTLTVRNSVLRGNSAKNTTGGGIFSSATFTIEGSTFTGNNASNSAGGVWFFPPSGSGATATITNSTFSGNFAPITGALSLSGPATMTHVTVANNSTGILVSNLRLRNSMIVNSTAGKNCINGTSGITSQGFNLDSGTDCGFSMATNDRSGVNPMLGPLADNGGPTPTHALPVESAAVNAIPNDACAATTDQRGRPRPFPAGGRCDIGAFELEMAAPMSPTTAPATMPTSTTAPTVSPIATPVPAVPPAAPPPAMMACTPFAPGSPFASAGFQSQWTTGEGLAPNFWGPTVTGALMEQYIETGGQRTVQYFDKGRMERGAGDTVTNGLLANELITGQMQVGDSLFMARGAANIPVAGDPDNAGPTYAGLGARATGLFSAATSRPGALVTTTVSAAGDATAGGEMSGGGPTAISAYDDVTQHNVPQAFAEYRARVGLAAIGLAKSEPFLTTVKVGGAQKQVMVQVFERRVLTYTADNPDAFRVEFGNIGQHYYRWRYCGG